MVAIMDDREDVWGRCTNLIHVKPYIFFVGTSDINAPPGSQPHTPHSLIPLTALQLHTPHSLTPLTASHPSQSHNLTASHPAQPHTLTPLTVSQPHIPHGLPPLTASHCSLHTITHHTPSQSKHYSTTTHSKYFKTSLQRFGHILIKFNTNAKRSTQKVLQ